MMRQFLTLIKHSELVALYGNTFFKTVFKNHRITSQTSFQRFKIIDLKVKLSDFAISKNCLVTRRLEVESLFIYWLGSAKISQIRAARIPLHSGLDLKNNKEENSDETTILQFYFKKRKKSTLTFYCRKRIFTCKSS